MVETAMLLLMNGILLMLRVSPADSFPRPLSKEKEREYLGRWEQGDIEARNCLVEHNLRLVSHILKKYYTQSEDNDDLISIGTIGLIKGINTYRADKGVRLATYVSRCIENEILMYFRAQKKSSGDISLSEALDMEGDGNGLAIIDVIAREDDMIERIGRREQCKLLYECIERDLTERESEIIKMRYGLGGRQPRTQRETAQEFGISRSYVSRIEKRALEKLRLALGEEV